MLCKHTHTQLTGECGFQGRTGHLDVLEKSRTAVHLAAIGLAGSSSKKNVRLSDAECLFFDAINPGSNLPFGKLFFSLFKFQITSEKHLFFNKNKGNNQNVENKVSGRVRVVVVGGLIVPIRWHPVNNLN